MSIPKMALNGLLGISWPQFTLPFSANEVGIIHNHEDRLLHHVVRILCIMTLHAQSVHCNAHSTMVR
jgi:hypothetical protein